MATMEVDLVSAERRLFQGESTGVYARSVEGQIGILPGHQPVLLELDPAPLTIESDGGRKVFGVHGGFLEYRGERLTILADGADQPEEIDRAAAEDDVRRARTELEDKRDDERVRRQLRIAQMRLELASSGG